MKSIFICYRREDSRQASGRIYDALVERIGPENVFKDVYSIVAGETWRDTINSFIDKSGVLLVMIGKNWQVERLADEEDTLRGELELARAANLKIVPVLLDDTKMPAADSLPKPLRWLTEYQATPLRDSDFTYDLDRLLKSLGIDQRRRHMYWAISCALVFSLALLLWTFTRPSPSPFDDLVSCTLPAGDVLGNADVTQRLISDQIALLATGKLDRSVLTTLYPMARRAASEKPLAEYMQCRSRLNFEFTDEQESHFDQMIAYLATEDSVLFEEFLGWYEAHPFPGRVPAIFSDIVISEFDESRRSEGAFAVAYRVENNLNEELAEYNLDSLSVSVLPQMTREEAQALADRGLNRVVIWGWYDAFDLNIRLMFGQDVDTDDDAIVTEVSLELPSSSNEAALRHVVSATLPATTSFLSLYLIGQLKFNSDEYIQGNRAFDGAMNIMPDELSINSPALEAFFRARRLQLGLPIQ